jgi:hypothetical protein
VKQMRPTVAVGLVFALPVVMIIAVALFRLDDDPLVAAVKSGQLVSIAFSVLATRLLMNQKSGNVSPEFRGLAGVVVAGGAVFVALFANLTPTERATLPADRTWVMFALQVLYGVAAALLASRVELELAQDSD